MTSPWLRRLAGPFLAATLAAPTAAQEAPPTETPAQAPAAQPAPPPTPPPLAEAEEIVVTGSYIRGTPENAALPVDVTSLQDLQDVGAPSVAELVRNLAYTSGNLAESNQFNAGGDGQAQEGVLTVNLRGLGSARTLVLLNGRRLAPGETIGSDLSILPKSAVGRLEVLKDGAAALYGSDAIGGVANFITRENFEGFEISASHQFIRRSDGDPEVALLGGWGNERLHLMGAFEWSHRGELGFRERSWGLIPEPANPQGGWSSIANPATILPFVPGVPLGTGVAVGRPDPNCATLGGALVGSLAAGGCRFQFTYFDNITEKQNNYKGYVEANYDFSDTTKLHVEGIYGLMDMPEWKSSPSYPPQSLFGPDRFIPASHPGFADMAAQNPGLFPAGTVGAFVLFRSIGVAGRPPDGSPLVAERETEQWRIVAELSGESGEGIAWEAAFTYASRERFLDGEDMFIERMAFALDGLGGPNCDPATGTAGTGPCMYYNPFSNAIERSAVNGVVNAQFNPAVANNPQLINWLFGPSQSWTTNKLFVGDAVLSGVIPWFSLPGGEIGWAAGGQVRREVYDVRLHALTDLDKNPCAFSNPFSVTSGNITQADFDLCQNGIANVTGPYAFLSGTRESHEERVVYGFFGELQFPFFDTLDAQLALRFENYGGRVGSTVDPKLSLRWAPLEWLTLRGSVSTTFRGPPQSFLSGRVTSLQFVPAANAFKAVDFVGNPDLKPESALTSNVGFVLEWEGLYASLDYWRFKFEDPFQLESFGQIVTAYSTIGGPDPDGAAGPRVAGCQTTLAGGGPGWGMDPANPLADPVRCNGIRQHLGFQSGTDTPASIQRVDTNFINGSEINTSGLDFYLQYEFELGDATLSIGSQGSYRIEYTSEDFVDIAGFFLAPGGEFNGLLNDGTAPFQPLPELKTDVFTKFTYGPHTATVVGRYVTDYVDVAPSVASLAKIDNFFTVDAHYVVRVFDDSTALSFSIFNIGDKDPPRASTDLNYDPFTHDGRGRMYKLGLTYTWRPE